VAGKRKKSAGKPRVVRGATKKGRRLPRFSRAELLFSAKSFAAAMLAMYLASRAGHAEGATADQPAA
jgi:hypothetical protein